MVVYSGGKFLRGPQTSGLLLGRKNLVQAAWRNAGPHQAIGRPMKVSKEDIVGVLAAVQYWFEDRDVVAEERRWKEACDVIAASVNAVPGVASELLPPANVVRVPRLRVRWDRSRVKLDGETMRQLLQDGTPRIMVDDMSLTKDSITLDPFGLQPGEAGDVGRAVAARLAAAQSAAVQSRVSAPRHVAGDWEVRVDLFAWRANAAGPHRAASFRADAPGRRRFARWPNGRRTHTRWNQVHS